MSKADSRDGRRRRVFSPEFKAEAVRLMRERQTAGASLAQIGRELDIGPDQLRTWARQFDPAGEPGRRAAPGGGETLDQEVRRLRRENATLKQERDFAKKAAAFFAKESR